jgi:ribonuclease VapC
VIIDTSAIVAVLFREPDWQDIVTVLADAEALAVGAPTLAETTIVVGTRLGFHRPHVPRFVQTFGVSVVSFAGEHWLEAGAAYRRYGRGRHPAKLNFGDCLTYAAAKLSQGPLLCKGRDFVQTDLDIVAY